MKRNTINTKELLTDLYRGGNQTVNYQCSVESILLVLLSQYCKIEISKPSKKCLVTQQFLKIMTINFGEDDSINVNDLIDKRCISRKEYEIKNDSNESTASRRIQGYKRIETIHLLVDLLREFNYKFKSKYVEGKKGVLKLEVVESIYHNDKLLFDLDTIHQKGCRINNFLYDLIVSSGSPYILHNDEYLLNYLFTYDNSTSNVHFY